jgi:integrase/recombinase XerD
MSIPEDAALTRANSDDKLIQVWLNPGDRPVNTCDAYRRDIDQFRQFLSYKSLQAMTLEDLQAYSLHLQERGLKDKTRRRKLNAIKSLFTFATKVNYVRFNVAAAIRLPRVSNKLAQRMMQPGETKKLVNQETESRNSSRNRIFIKLMYGIGARVSEVCNLTWESFVERPDGKVQVTIHGKGDKSREVLVPEQVWAEVRTLRDTREGSLRPPNASPELRIFNFGRKQAWSILKQSVEAAELNPRISPHWTRHAHAFDALRNKAPLQLVRDTLGHSNISTTNWYLESMPDESSSDYLNF